jgi:hypothetical protein
LDDFVAAQNAYFQELINQADVSEDRMQIDDEYWSEEDVSMMDVEGNTMMSIDFDRSADTTSVADSREMSEPDILPPELCPPAPMPTTTENDFRTHLLVNLATIPVPASFRDRDVSMVVLYRDLCHFVGLNEETSQLIAERTVDAQSLSITDIIEGCIKRRWRDVIANNANNDGEPMQFESRLAELYEQVGVVNSFAAKCAKYVVFDPLMHLLDILRDSMSDALTLRRQWISGAINHAKAKQGGKKPKAKDEETMEPPFNKKVTQKYVAGKFTPLRELDPNDPHHMYAMTSKWTYEDDKLTGYRSFSQEAAVVFDEQRGFTPSHTYTGGDLYGTVTSNEIVLTCSRLGILCRPIV